MRRTTRTSLALVLAALALAALVSLAVAATPSVTSAPKIEGEWVSHLTSTDMTLEAEINTRGLETTYEFGMVTSPSCLHAKPVPCEIAQSVILLPSGKLDASLVAQCVSLDVGSAAVLEPGGEYAWGVEVTNAAGSAGGQSQHVKLTEPQREAELRPHCPDTTITTTTITHTRSTATLSFNFRATETMARRFECELIEPRRKRHPKPEASFSTCKSPKTYKYLVPGTYRFEVRALNSSGADSTPAIKKVKVRPRRA